MKVLVTGTEGYLGSLLSPLLIEAGHEVIGVDTGFYKQGWLYNGVTMSAQTLCKDIRHIEHHDLRGVQAIVHMAELSNDPLGQLAPDVTLEINHRASLRLAQLAKEAGAKRFVYTSSCSVYGLAEEEVVDERSPVNPQTTYALCKTLVERDVAELAEESFSPTFLRNATAFGASPRMRFDIVLNNLAGWAWTARKIKMTSDGSPWRPLVHALDICRAICCTLQMPRARVHNQVLNVGDSRLNYRVRDVAEIVADIFPGCDFSVGERGGDNRSYRVSFDKIHDVLPNFRCAWDAERGAKQLHDVFSHIALRREDFESPAYARLKQLEVYLSTGQLDQRFFWQQPGDRWASAPDTESSVDGAVG